MVDLPDRAVLIEGLQGWRFSRSFPLSLLSGFCLCSRVEFRSLARSASVIDRSL